MTLLPRISSICCERRRTHLSINCTYRKYRVISLFVIFFAFVHAFSCLSLFVSVYLLSFLLSFMFFARLVISAYTSLFCAYLLPSQTSLSFSMNPVSLSFPCSSPLSFPSLSTVSPPRSPSLSLSLSACITLTMYRFVFLYLFAPLLFFSPISPLV